MPKTMFIVGNPITVKEYESSRLFECKVSDKQVKSSFPTGFIPTPDMPVSEVLVFSDEKQAKIVADRFNRGTLDNSSGEAKVVSLEHDPSIYQQA